MTDESELIHSRRVVEEFIIPKCSSKAFLLKKGQYISPAMLDW